MTRRRDVHGVLVVDKPAGVTSADVVTEVRRRLGVRRVGHTGTLDPLATGVLPICLGEATKLAGYLIADDKGYEAELELGVETDTLDADGEVVARAPERAAAVSEGDLRAALARFVGSIEQVPPMFSALKLGGRRLHELARDGVEIVRDARPVVIAELRLLAFAPPRARIAVACSKGTYVRTLVADLGQVLGCGAHLTALRRTLSGRFHLGQAVPMDDLRRAPPISLPEVLGLPSAVIPTALHRSVLDGRLLTPQSCDASHVLHSWPPPPSAAGSAPEASVSGESDMVQLLTPEGALLALARVVEGNLHPFRVFTYGLTELGTSANLRRSIEPNP